MTDRRHQNGIVAAFYADLPRDPDDPTLVKAKSEGMRRRQLMIHHPEPVNLRRAPASARAATLSPSRRVLYDLLHTAAGNTR